jgi:hypothetical protein
LKASVKKVEHNSLMRRAPLKISDEQSKARDYRKYPWLQVGHGPHSRRQLFANAAIAASRVAS